MGLEAHLGTPLKQVGFHLFTTNFYSQIVYPSVKKQKQAGGMKCVF
jgi:hypothetical protein